jgi:hypothetical protein
MKKFLRSAVMVTTGIITAVALPLASAPMARAISASCPTDPLEGRTPYTADYPDNNPVNVGVKFNIAGGATSTGVKFYKGSGNTGTHVAHLRAVGGGSDLASATYTSETSSGWQSVDWSSPVDLNPANTYEVWVSMPVGDYSVDGEIAGGSNYFEFAQFGANDDVVHIPQGQSGLYEYTSTDTDVPTNTTYNNYWVSPVVDDSTAPTSHTGVSASDASSGPTVSWSGGGVDANGVRTDVLRYDGTNTVVVGSQAGGASSWIDNPNSAAQADTTALPGTTYTYRLKDTDACSNTTTTSASPVTTASQSLSTIFSSTAPSSVDSTQATPLVVGNHWQASTSGHVWGVRMYRPASAPVPTVADSNGQTPQLKVHLWDNDGTDLGSAWVPAGNAQSGWIDVRFASPVAVSASHDYVVGYFSPNGHEAYQNNVLTSDVTNGALTMTADTGGTPNGVYIDSSVTPDSFPTNRSLNSTWYGVDVDFY